MDQLVIVIKNGVEMQANSNPDGLKELARFGWKVKPVVDEAAAKKLADEAQFKALAEQCKTKDIKVVAADTIETLTEKLSK